PVVHMNTGPLASVRAEGEGPGPRPGVGPGTGPQPAVGSGTGPQPAVGAGTGPQPTVETGRGLQPPAGRGTGPMPAIEASGPAGLGTDTVAIAAATPERPQPYAELGMNEEEYRRVRHILGRRPTSAELAIYSVMWSEHCSYKSSKVHL